MKTLAMISAVFALAACQSDNKNLEKKIDDLSKKVDALVAGGGGRGAAAPQRPSRPQPDVAKTYALSIDGDPFEGPADAKVTIVKAYDYACPYCEKAREPMKELRQKYGNDIRIVYKQFVVHPQVATTGALAFCAAAKQGKATQMDELLWEKGFKAHNYDKDATADGGAAPQKCWDSPAGCPIVLGFAKELNLNEAQFKTDMKDCQQLAQKDMKDLQTLGVGATPSFFINGRFMSGLASADAYSTLIDEEMKKANERIQAGTPAAQYYQEWVVNKGQKTLDAPKQ